MTDAPLKTALKGLFIGGVVGLFAGFGIAGKFDQRAIDYATPNKIVVEDTRACSVNNLWQTNYFQYDGNWYELGTNKGEVTEK